MTLSSSWRALPWITRPMTRLSWYSSIRGFCHWSLKGQIGRTFSSSTPLNTRSEGLLLRSCPSTTTPMTRRTCPLTSLLICKCLYPLITHEIQDLSLECIFWYLFHHLFSFLTVIDKDNEENAEIAVKSIFEMQKFYRNTFFVLVSPRPYVMPCRVRRPEAMIAFLRPSKIWSHLLRIDYMMWRCPLRHCRHSGGSRWSEIAARTLKALPAEISATSHPTNCPWRTSYISTTFTFGVSTSSGRWLEIMPKNSKTLSSMSLKHLFQTYSAKLSSCLSTLNCSMLTKYSSISWSSCLSVCLASHNWCKTTLWSISQPFSDSWWTS